MSLRRYGPLALAFASLVACTDVKQEDPAPLIVIATFASPNIPTPNDLVLQAVPTLPDSAQKELLQSFIDAGGFPSDQEVSITVPFRAMSWNGTAYEAATAPAIDPATVTASTVVLLKVDGAPQVVETEAGSSTDGRLIIRKRADASGSRRLAPGRYVVAVRGGPSGVKTGAASGALPVGPDQPIALIAPNKDLSQRENQPPGLPAALVQQLETLRSLYWNPISWGAAGGMWAPSPSAGVTPAFTAVSQHFPPAEVAALATFGVAPAAAAPLTDSGSGQIPLPSTFLLDGSRPVEGTGGTRFFVRNVPAFGPAAAGLATLDGFSTTGMMLAPLSAPVNAATVTRDSVLLFELPDGAGVPRRMRDVAAALGAGAPATAEYLTQPPALNRDVQGASVTTAIGLQPGVAVPVPGVGIVYTPPLKQKKNYLVVITDRVQDLAGNGLKRSTLANILFTFANPPVDAEGHSTLSGVADADAAALNALRTQLNPVLDNIGAISGDPSLTKDDVVMAYTVQTQTVSDTSVGLSALPYQTPAAFNASDVAPLDLATLGFDAATQAALFPNVGGFLTASVVTLDAINPANGALDPDTGAWTPTGIPAVIALPKVDATCTPAAPCVRPLVVWHHGLNGGRLQMLTVADSLAARGFIVAAIDAPYHGDRAFCTASSECTTDGTADGVCTPDQTRAGQGDQVPPGTCTTGHLRGTNLTTVASGNYFISGNFFRIRDAIRQDLLDHAALVLALAPPQVPPTTAFAGTLAQAGLMVNPGAVYLEGQSLGGIIGTEILAANPRFARGVLSVPGGSLVDVFTNAPAFKDDVDALFLSLGIDRALIPTDAAVASRYLQTLILAKWILDPAEPLNYAASAKTKLASPLFQAPPNGMGGTGLVHPTTEVLGQLSRCDQVVPNATTVVGGVPLPYGDELFALGGIDDVLYQTAAEGGCVPHGVLADTFLTPLGTGTTIGGQVRDQAAQFLLDLTVPASPVTLP